MAFTFLPTNASSIDVCIGVHDTLSNYIITDENIREIANFVDILDQQGRLAQKYATEKHWEGSFTCIGPTQDGIPGGSGAGSTLVWHKPGTDDDLSVIITQCDLNYSNTDVAKWSVSFEGYENAKYENDTDDALPSN